MATKIKVTRDILDTIASVTASYSRLGTYSAGMAYVENGERWIENEIFARDYVEVESWRIVELMELTPVAAMAQAAVDCLSIEFDKTQEFVPDCVIFSANLFANFPESWAIVAP